MIIEDVPMNLRSLMNELKQQDNDHYLVAVIDEEIVRAKNQEDLIMNLIETLNDMLLNIESILEEIN